MHNRPTDDQLELAAQAAEGDETARRRVNELVDPIIEFQTSRFCKRFCRENQHRYRCSLRAPWGSAPADADLCEWGNASYGWMLDDLTRSKRLQRYQARDGSTLYNYLYQIANSLPFYERWKDWRFGRKVHVPTYIKELGTLAAKVFLALRAQQNVELIAQNTGADTATVEHTCQQIIGLLTKKRRLHLLDPPKTVSLTQPPHDDEHDDNGLMEIASFDEPAEAVEQKNHLKHAWQQLTAVEQFVLEALVIEDQDAATVLDALRTMGVSIKRGVAAADTDRQQLYYFRRKTLARLSELMTEAENA